MVPLHPLIVHFPIALTFASAVFFSLAFVSENRSLSITGFWLLLGAEVGMLASIITGNIAYSTLILTADLKKISELHEILGWIAIWLNGILLVWYFLRRTNQIYIEKAFFLFLLFLGLGVIGFSGYLGGKMVYEKGGGVKPMEEFLKHKKEREEENNGGSTVMLKSNQFRYS